MRRIIILLLVSASLLAAPPAHAAMKIRTIAFDPAGRDDGTNRSLNKEWIYIVNTGPSDIQLRGWKIVDAGRDHVYRFPSLFVQDGDTIRLHTGRGRDGAPVCEAGSPCPDDLHFDLYLKLDNYVWNNGGDKARLIRPNGNIVDTCAYGGSSESPVSCQ